MTDAPARIASLYLDGDRLALISGERHGGEFRVTHAEHRRLPRPFERIRRLRHPVYLDSDLAIFPEEEYLQAELNRLLSAVPEDVPVLTVLAPDKERREALKGPRSPEEQALRRSKLLRRALPASPYDYPCLVVMKDAEREAGASCTRLLSIRMAELLPMQRLVRNAGREHWGTIPGLTAANALAYSLREAMSVEQLNLMDCGALRTLFVTSGEIATSRNNVIPVGYLSTRKSGEMFTHEPEREIPHFARRFVRETVPGPDRDGNLSLCLLGFPDPIASLSGRIAEATGYTPADIPQEVLAAIAEGWPEGVPFAPASLALGGLLAMIPRAPEQFGPLRGDLVSPPLANGKCAVSRMKDGRLYVFEQRYPL